MDKIADIPFFFVVGRPRSGTTLLRTLFDAHPNVNFPPECQFIVNLYPKYGRINNWNEKNINEFYNDLISQWLFDTWKIDNDVLKKRLLTYVGNHSYGTICKAVYLEYNSLFNKESIDFIGDKNPGYAIYTKLLTKIFPEAKFIHIIRDYRDNFVSIKNVDFELPVPSLVVQKWKYFYKKFKKDSLSNPDSYRLQNYEKLARNPQTEFAQLCDFIGINYNESVFNFHEKKDDLLKQYPSGYIKTYHTSLLEKVNTSKIGVWKMQLSVNQVKIMDYTAGYIAEESGYEREYKGFNPWISIIALPGRTYAALLYIATIIVDSFPYKIRMAILIKGPLFLAKAYLSIFNRKKLRELDSVIIKKK